MVTNIDMTSDETNEFAEAVSWVLGEVRDEPRFEWDPTVQTSSEIIAKLLNLIHECDVADELAHIATIVTLKDQLKGTVAV